MVFSALVSSASGAGLWIVGFKFTVESRWRIILKFYTWEPSLTTLPPSREAEDGSGLRFLNGALS